ncbi:hypothetical protein V497_03109 [Pseudogymnoascus sp. VKM F-4516 (FW-969)]|nr:hypothetical protein V497_03109 [Pseudogymnoascus sp. VKM F-4516 (FW-969)]
MFVSAEIEIAASPEECRRVFLDWESWGKIKEPVIRSISRIPHDKSGPVERGEKLKVNMSGMEVKFTALENTPSEFKWRFDMFLVLSGIHSYRFEPSKTTPGHTRFINEEEFIRFSNILMRIMPVEKSFHEFLVDICIDFTKENAKGQTNSQMAILWAMYGGIFCNWAYNELTPFHGSLTEIVCGNEKGKIEKDFGEGKAPGWTGVEGGPLLDLQNDNQNCGTVSNICTSGLCINSACTSPTCAATSYSPGSLQCGTDNACFCAIDTQGHGFCATSDRATCSGIAIPDECTGNDDPDGKGCVSGYICSTSPHCGNKICLDATTCKAAPATSSSPPRAPKSGWTFNLPNDNYWANDISLQESQYLVVDGELTVNTKCLLVKKAVPISGLANPNVIPAGTEPVCYNLRVVECSLTVAYHHTLLNETKEPLPANSRLLGISLCGFHEAYFKKHNSSLPINKQLQELVKVAKSTGSPKTRVIRKDFINIIPQSYIRQLQLRMALVQDTKADAAKEASKKVILRKLLQNAAVHREEASASTTRRHARITLDVLETLRRLGNEHFEEAYGSSLDRLFRSFWDVDSDLQAIALPLDLLEMMREQDPLETLSAEEKKNIEFVVEQQRLAERRKDINFAKMGEDIVLAKRKRAVNQQIALQQKEAAAKARAERMQKVKDQEKKAAQTRTERALRIKLQEEVAAQSKRECASKAEALGRSFASGGRGTKMHSPTTTRIYKSDCRSEKKGGEGETSREDKVRNYDK